MPPIVPLNQVPAAPGVYPILGLAGTFSTQPNNPGRCYLIGTGSTGSTLPTRVSSLDEFVALYGVTPQVTRDVVESFFQSLGSAGELYYLRVPSIVAPALITVASIVSALNSFDSARDSHGYVICPEAYYHLSTADRLATFNALESFVSLQDYQWVHVADASPPAEYFGAAAVTVNGKTIAPSQTGTAVNPIGSLSTNLATLSASYVTEAGTYNSPAGHSSYAANPAINLANRLVPASIGTVIAAQIRYGLDSYRVAPAGTKAPMRGVVGVYASFNKTHQSTLNGSNVNILRVVNGYGVCMMGARTRYNADSAYKFIHVRVIFNVLVADLTQAYQPMIFDPVDGAGIVFTQARDIAIQRLVRMWQAGVLYGQTPKQAFKVICDASNNPAFDLENGDLRVSVYAAPCGVAERLLIGIVRVPIGQVPA